MAISIEKVAGELVDREAIRDCIYRIFRAVDRQDWDKLWECFWPDATDNHAGIYKGPMTDAVEAALPFLSKMTATSHIVSNILIDIDGDFAKSETYVQGCHAQDDPEKVNVIAVGRLLDQWQRRGDEWRLLDRNLILDWFMNVPRDGDWATPRFGHNIGGKRDRSDFSHQYLDSGPKTTI